jgi:16S rRNA processing protein RimM
VTSYTDRPEDVASYGPVSDEKGEKEFELEVMRIVKAQVLARIPGVADRDAAEALRGVRLFVPRDRLPAPGPEEFYYDDLIGMAVETMDGAALGEVVSVQEFGGGDMLEIGARRGRTFMVPFTRAAVPVVDLAAGLLRVDPPDGLLEDGLLEDGLLEEEDEEEVRDDG